MSGNLSTMPNKLLFLFGVAVGVGALIMLFTEPADRFWFVLFIISGALTAPRRSETESTRDVANIALTVAFFATAALFALLLIPESFWGNLQNRVPEWMYGRPREREAIPLWGRVVLPSLWLLVTGRRFQQMRMAEE